MGFFWGKILKSIKEIASANIASYRRKADMTQRDVAVALGVTVNSVHLWEKGTTWPEADKFDRMAELFGIPAWEFFNASAPSLDASLALVLEELGYDSSALKKKKRRD